MGTPWRAPSISGCFPLAARSPAAFPGVVRGAAVLGRSLVAGPGVGGGVAVVPAPGAAGGAVLVVAASLFGAAWSRATTSGVLGLVLSIGEGGTAVSGEPFVPGVVRPPAAAAMRRRASRSRRVVGAVAVTAWSPAAVRRCPAIQAERGCSVRLPVARRSARSAALSASISSRL